MAPGQADARSYLDAVGSRSSRTRVAFATWCGAPDVSADDNIAADACRARGIIVEGQPWDASCDWRSYDAVVVRTTWNYHRRAQQFAVWVDHLEDLGIPLWNPPAVVRWNMHKQYLFEMREPDVRVPTTVLVPTGTHTTLATVMDDHGWSEAVVKPAISASAFRTALVARTRLAEAETEFSDCLRDCDMLVQQLVPEIGLGELSLIFFNGQFSHGVRKAPAPGEFRAQEMLGATVECWSPDPLVVERCRRILRQVPGPTLYARVDGIPLRDAFVLLEVEVIEPSLFMSFASGAAESFAEALLAKIDGASNP